MNKFWKVSFILLIAVFVISEIVAAKSDLNSKKGLLMVLAVKTDPAVAAFTNIQVVSMKNICRNRSISYEKIICTSLNRMEVVGIDPENQLYMQNILAAKMKNWTSSASENNLIFMIKPEAESRIREHLIDEVLVIIHRRIHELGAVNPIIRKEGIHTDRIRVELPILEDPERVKKLILTPARLEFKEIVSGPFPSEVKAKNKYKGRLPKGVQLLRQKTEILVEEPRWFIVNFAPIIDGKGLKNASRSQDEYGAPAIGLHFTDKEAKKLELYTKTHIGKCLAIALDNQIEAVPTIRSIISAIAIIHGRFHIQEVDDIVLMLKSGSLPATLRIVEERII
jgi:preprotein translocase subunit SecD